MMLSKKLMLPIILALTIPCIAQETDEEIYKRGIQIMKTDGVKVGLKYFEGKPVTHLSLFGIGWVYWTERNFKKAEEVCRYLLIRQIDNTLRAHVNYLMGYLNIEYTEYPDAISHFAVALPIYKKTNKPKDQFRTLLGLATANFYLENYNKMDSLINQAQSVRGTNSLKLNLGHYYFLKAHLASVQKDYLAALLHSQASYAEHEKSQDIESLANAMIDVSFYLYMNRRFDEGLEMLERTQAIILEHDLKRISYLNTINYIFVYRCSGVRYDDHEKRVRRAAEKMKDKLMLEALEYMLSVNCP